MSSNLATPTNLFKHLYAFVGTKGGACVDVRQRAFVSLGGRTTLRQLAFESRGDLRFPAIGELPSVGQTNLGNSWSQVVGPLQERQGSAQVAVSHAAQCR